MIQHILRHDLRQIIYTRKTWYYLAGMQIALSLIFNWLMRNFLKQQAMASASLYGITEEVLHPYYAWFTLLVLVLVPTMCTQILCAERQQKTLINLLCAPITPLQIILSKFLVLNCVLILACLSISCMPLTICVSGALDWGQMITGIFGLYLMLSATMGVGLAVASFMTSSMRCNLLVFFVLAGLVLLEWAAQYSGKYALILQGYGLLNPLKSYLSGIFNLQFTAYYVLIIYATIFIASWGLVREKN